MPKLLARLRSVFRRTEERIEATDVKSIVRLGPFEINPLTYKVRVKGKETVFPRKEFEILAYLARNAGRVISRETLLRRI
ncbi:MAG: DNA-binding response regulator, partial [Candidatus Latescibacteria bacterium]|nr:DNA-binding response regulator [Candidatus Latescibacterota bacterium]NIO77500.1 DNA-binding response regulator [Candidatus Latescibacterota bacterium]